MSTELFGGNINMKVLQINTTCGRGSTGRIAVDIHKLLLEQGHESVIAYGRGEPLNCDNTIKIGNKIDFYNHALKTRLLDRHCFGSKKATQDFVDEVKNYSPDIIHLHNIHGYYLNIEILFNFLKKFNKPVVWTLHDCWAFTGHCSHFDYANCYKWETHCQKCPERKSYPKSMFIDNSYNNYEKKRSLFTSLDKLTLVTPSEWLAKLVKRSFLKEYPVKVINNGIDLNVFKPTPSDFRKKYNLENKFIILGVANKWGKRKGFEYFIELSKQLSEDEIIVLVGLSKKQVKTLPANIIGIERTNSITELAEIYSVADVFVNPTLEENYPTVNLEAQACGTYALTFDSGGARETILSESTGKCLTQKKPDEILYSLRTIETNGLAKTFKLKAYNENGFMKFDKALMIGSYLSLYDEVLERCNNATKCLH